MTKKSNTCSSYLEILENTEKYWKAHIDMTYNSAIQ